MAGCVMLIDVPHLSVSLLQAACSMETDKRGLFDFIIIFGLDSRSHPALRPCKFWDVNYTKNFNILYKNRL